MRIDEAEELMRASKSNGLVMKDAAKDVVGDLQIYDTHNE